MASVHNLAVMTDEWTPQLRYLSDKDGRIFAKFPITHYRHIMRRFSKRRKRCASN